MNPQATSQILPSTPCNEALDLWLKQHSTYIGRRTQRTYRQYVKNLSEYFAAKPLSKIGIGSVREYQASRKQTCVASTVNAEISCLQMCMKEVDLWDPIAKLYRPLPVPKTKVRQNMSEEEETRLMKAALKDPRRRLAGHCLITMANTSMGFGELRHLKRQHVFLDAEIPSVEVNEGAKNDYRLRSIPLNALALRSIRWIVKRWESLGGKEPDEYILPHHARRSPEEQLKPGHRRTSPPIFTEPMGHIYRAARSILKEAGLSHLNPYDMRSHAITKILSNPNCSDQIYKEIVGHVSEAMKRRYSKQRLENKRGVLDAMCEKQLHGEIAAAEAEARTSTGLLPAPGAAPITAPAPLAPDWSGAAFQAQFQQFQQLVAQQMMAQQVAFAQVLQQQLVQHVPPPIAAPPEQVAPVHQPQLKLIAFPSARTQA